MVLLSSHESLTSHSPTAVYALWADPPSWPSWDPELRVVSFGGPLVTGAKGKLQPRNGPALGFTITGLQHDHEFTNTGSLPGAKLAFQHVVTETLEGAMVSVKVSLDGPLSRVWARLMGPEMADSARSSVEGLLRYLDQP